MPLRLDEPFADRPFDPAAYEFVLQSLDRAIRHLDPPRHISGSELLEGVSREARREFGPMAAHVLKHWGISGAEDIGTIVFDLVDRGILARNEEDQPEDFAGANDFLGRLESEYYRDHPGFAEPGDRPSG